MRVHDDRAEHERRTQRNIDELAEKLLKKEMETQQLQHIQERTKLSHRKNAVKLEQIKEKLDCLKSTHLQVKQNLLRTREVTHKLDLEKRDIAHDREKNAQKQKAVIEKKLQEGEDMILFREVLKSYTISLA